MYFLPLNPNLCSRLEKKTGFFYIFFNAKIAKKHDVFWGWKKSEDDGGIRILDSDSTNQKSITLVTLINIYQRKNSLAISIMH